MMMMMIAKIRKCCLSIIILLLLMSTIDGLRVNKLSLLHKDSSSITIEWQIDQQQLEQLEQQGKADEWIGFKIKYFTDKFQYTPIVIKNAQIRKFRLENLQSNIEFRIQVSSFNKLNQEGPSSHLLTVKTLQTVPNEPRDLKVNKVTSNTIEIEWKPPLSAAAEAINDKIKGYKVNYFKVNHQDKVADLHSNFLSGSTVNDIQSFKIKSYDRNLFDNQQPEEQQPNSILRTTIVNLEANSLYKIQIFAYNLRGDGKRSPILLVNTLSLGPNKPEGIRSEIYDYELLNIKWQAPAKSTGNLRNEQIDGYRIFFNNERFNVDANTHYISIKRPKWEYDREYEFRIAAKAANYENVSNIYGQEAVYTISTHKNSNKIEVKVKKLTSKSALIKWSNVTLMPDHGTEYTRFYKLEYYPKDQPKQLFTHDRLRTQQLQIIDLKPATDYIIQLYAYIDNINDKKFNQHKPVSETTIKHFRTLLFDIEAPRNLQLLRYEPEKLNIKWDPLILLDKQTSLSLIKGYRIYHKEIIQHEHNYDYKEDEDTEGEEEDFYDFLIDDEWKMIEQLSVDKTEVNLLGLNVNSDYAIKVSAFDYSMNEGSESDVRVAKKFKYEGTEEKTSSLFSNFNKDQSREAATIRKLDIKDLTSTSVKFEWMPPQISQTLLKYYLISFVDEAKNYTEVNSSVVRSHSGLSMSVKVPVRNDQSQKITWMVTSLQPNTVYHFNVSAVLKDDIEGGAQQRRVRTLTDRSPNVHAPQIIAVFPDNTVTIRPGNASTKNGPIAKYWLCVTPFLRGTMSDFYSNDPVTDLLRKHEPKEHDISRLLAYSVYDKSHPRLYANETGQTYIAIEFDAAYLPPVIGLGDGRVYGRFFNRYLLKGFDYKAYMIAFTREELLPEEGDGRMDPDNGGDQINRVGLGQLLTHYTETPLSAFSEYSHLFNTRDVTTGGFNRSKLDMSHQRGSRDYHNILWIGGAIASFVFILILVLIVSLHLMQKKKKEEKERQQQQNIVQTTLGNTTMQRSTATINRQTKIHYQQQQQQLQEVSSSSTTMTNTNMAAVEMTATLNQYGSVTANLLSNLDNRSDISIKSGAGGSINRGGGRGSINPTPIQQISESKNSFNKVITNPNGGGTGSNSQRTGSMSQSSQSSSPTTTTASPTQALLANHNKEEEHKMITLSNHNGLLTAASPLKSNGHHNHNLANGGGTINGSMQMNGHYHFNNNNNSMNSSQGAAAAESLYTSIEATQRLLLGSSQNKDSQHYDNNQHFMMLNNVNNSFNSGTLTRQLQQQHQRFMNYEDIKKPQSQQALNERSAASSVVPAAVVLNAIPLNELFQQIERLKAQQNALFTQEYESIEPLLSTEQQQNPNFQFSWQHSVHDINRQKNRYANVIAYDHSRVVISKLPIQSFALSTHATPTHQSYSSPRHHQGGGIDQTYGQLGNYVLNGVNNAMSVAHNLLNNFSSNSSGQQQLLLPPTGHSSPLSLSSSATTTPVSSSTTQSAILTTPSATQLSNCSDYINANYIHGYSGSISKAQYIATQGPLPGTMGDFWRMCWEQRTHLIVMITRLEERQRLKCDRYWPVKGTELYGHSMQVTLLDTVELAHYTLRTFVIAPVAHYAHAQMQANVNNPLYELRREIKHIQFTAWPDHGVPTHATSFIQFVRRCRTLRQQQEESEQSGPIVVHCSAGVGRTGCFCVVDTQMDRMQNEDTVDIYDCVRRQRAQRNYMVQTEEQYQFCYETVLECSQAGLTEIPTRLLYSHLQHLLQFTNPVLNNNQSEQLTEMELEYKRLSSVKAPHSKFQSANLAANKFKNRLVNILPYESTRVVLQPLMQQVTTTTDDKQQTTVSEQVIGSDYINANYIDGYRQRRAYIATQAPLAETMADFWRMLWEQNSSLVVMLTKLREMGREKCVQYWPGERSQRYQWLVVEPVAEYNMVQYILREFKCTDARDGQSRTIRQFQLLDWPEQGVPKSAESLIELIGQVHKTKEQFGQTGPITVHCSAGVGRTGVFITLAVVLERCRYEGVVDVFSTVKLLRTQRPAMVQTEDQYQFCYRAALEYLGSVDGFD